MAEGRTHRALLDELLRRAASTAGTPEAVSRWTACVDASLVSTPPHTGQRNEYVAWRFGLRARTPRRQASFRCRRIDCRSLVSPPSDGSFLGRYSLLIGRIRHPLKDFVVDLDIGPGGRIKLEVPRGAPDVPLRPSILRATVLSRPCRGGRSARFVWPFASVPTVWRSAPGASTPARSSWLPATVRRGFASTSGDFARSRRPTARCRDSQATSSTCWPRARCSRRARRCRYRPGGHRGCSAAPPIRTSWLVAEDVAHPRPAPNGAGREALERTRLAAAGRAGTSCSHAGARRRRRVVFTCSDWTGGLAALYHRFELLAVAEDAQHERVLRDLSRMQVGAVVTDWPDRAVDAFRLFKTRRSGGILHKQGFDLEPAEVRQGQTRTKAVDDELLRDGTETTAVLRRASVITHHPDEVGWDGLWPQLCMSRRRRALRRRRDRARRASARRRRSSGSDTTPSHPEGLRHA